MSDEDLEGLSDEDVAGIAPPTALAQVFGPQEPEDDRMVVAGVNADGSLKFRYLDYDDLDLGARFGRSATSATENTVSYGEKVFVLDTAEFLFITNDTVQIRLNTDAAIWMSGPVVKVEEVVDDDDPEESATVITVNVTGMSGEDLEGYADWHISNISQQELGLPASAALGYSETEFAIPAVGDLQSFIVSPGKILPSNAVVLVRAAGAPADHYFVAIVRRYNIGSGAIEVMSYFVPEGAEGTFAEWFVTCVDLNVDDVDLFATSATEVTIEPNADKIFVVQEGKGFPVGGSVVIGDIEADNKAIWEIVDYSGTNLTVRLLLPITVTTGTSDAWVVRLLDGPAQDPAFVDMGFITDDDDFGPLNDRFVREDATVLEDLGLITDSADTFEDEGSVA